MFRVTFCTPSGDYAIYAADNPELTEILEFLEAHDYRLHTVLPDPVFLCLEDFQEFMNDCCPECEDRRKVSENEAKGDIEQNLKELSEGS